MVEGNALELKATVTGLPRPEITWYRNDAPVTATPNTIIKYENDLCKLKISPIKPGQEGTYKCLAFNPAGTADCVAKVVVEGKTEKPTFTRPLSNRECKEGKSVKFECTVTGIPQPDVEWFLNEKLIEAGLRFHIDHKKGYSNDFIHSLSLDTTDVADSGTIKAVAKNRVGEASTDATLTVDFKKEGPKFIKKLEPVEISEFSKAVFTVQVSGRPKPHVTWVLGDQEIKDGDDFKIEVDEQSHTMTINKANPKQAGVITARAQNPAGQVSCNSRLKVTPAKKPAFTKTLSDTVVPENGTIKLECKATGVPKPEMKLFINEKEIVASPTTTMETNPKDGTFTVTIPNATSEFNGQVKAVATNIAGEADCTAKLEVRGRAPTFLETPLKITIMEGAQAEFRCKVDGEPKPKLEWSKGKWVKVTKGPKYDVFEDEATGEHVFILKNTVTKDAGTYTVTATNEHGSQQAPASLIITNKEEDVVDLKSQLKKREHTQFKKQDDDAPFQVNLKKVEKEEEEAPPKEIKPAPEPKEIERLQYIPAAKRERPELEESKPVEFHIEPREKPELEQAVVMKPPEVAAAKEQEEEKKGYQRAVKTKTLEDKEDKHLILPKVQVNNIFFNCNVKFDYIFFSINQDNTYIPQKNASAFMLTNIKASIYLHIHSFMNKKERKKINSKDPPSVIYLLATLFLIRFITYEKHESRI